MNFTLLLIGLHSLILHFGRQTDCTGDIKGRFRSFPQKRKLWLGVYADYSKTVVIRVASIRFFAALHTSWTWAVFLFWLLFNYSKQSASATVAAKTRFANY
ncbi:uncharacterized protein METZ01_LOCUS19333 [marine metagenome]|uniref:Uncharacterized protein n=1 Tax=marine metagenome TaxID=408172 RepID=A0A381PK80_9ZZZZ